MSLVLDSSVTLAWIYVDEMSPAVQQVSNTVNESGAWVPSIWHLEIGNSLQLSMRKGRIDKNFRDESLADLARLNIRIDPETDRFAWTDTLDLAERFDLTCYDACYLELAQRLQMPLASLDRKLRFAAERLRVSLLGA